MKRATRFLINVLQIFLIIIFIFTILYLIQIIFHPFDELIITTRNYIKEFNQTLNKNIISGISVGMLVLILVLFFLPILMNTVRAKQYIVSIQRGIISSFVYMLSELLYTYVERAFGKFYFLFALLVVIILTFIMIEFMALLMTKDDEKEFKTEIIASITSGLLFGIIVRLTSEIINSIHISF